MLFLECFKDLAFVVPFGLFVVVLGIAHYFEYKWLDERKKRRALESRGQHANRSN